MTDMDREQLALTIAVEDEHAGSDLQALGWILVACAALGSIWIFTGLRSGSLFWVWYCLVTGGIGMVCVAAGSLLRSKAARDFATASGIVRSRTAPTIAVQELRPPEDIHREAA